MKQKNQLFTLVIIVLFGLIGCSKKEPVNNNQTNESPKLNKTEYGGCFLGQGGFKSTNSTDTIYYEIVSDTLLLHLVINRNCASNPLDSVVICQDSVSIYIKDRVPPIANCDCDFKFDYYFTNFNLLHKYLVYYKDFGANNYHLWGSLTYP